MPIREGSTDGGKGGESRRFFRAGRGAGAAKAEEKTEAAAAEKADGLPYAVKDGRATVVSKARAGKKIIARTGEVIEFGADGKASVRAEDAVYLSAIAGFDFG